MSSPSSKCHCASWSSSVRTGRTQIRCVHILRMPVARGGLDMNKNDDYRKGMNGWRKNKQGAYGKKNSVRQHNDPGAPRLLMYTEEGERGIFITLKLTSGQFPKHDLNSQSIKQAERKSTRGSSSTQQHQYGDLQRLTNPLQQQHPLGGLELCAYWSINPPTTPHAARSYSRCSLTMTLQPTFL